MSDTSDGLAAQVKLICEASGTGAVVEAGMVPVAPVVQQVAGRYGGNALHWALYGGEDYELMAAVDPGDFKQVRMAFESAGRLSPGPAAKLTVVGRFTSDSAILLELERGGRQPLGETEWQHF
jgi:thiamine-monophosphate kinase